MADGPFKVEPSEFGMHHDLVAVDSSGERVGYVSSFDIEHDAERWADELNRAHTLGAESAGGDRVLYHALTLDFEKLSHAYERCQKQLADVTKDRDRWVTRMQMLEQRIAEALIDLTGHAAPKTRAPYPPEVMALIDALDHARARSVLNQDSVTIPHSLYEAVIDARTALIGAKP